MDNSYLMKTCGVVETSYSMIKNWRVDKTDLHDYPYLQIVDKI